MRSGREIDHPADLPHTIQEATTFLPVHPGLPATIHQRLVQDLYANQPTVLQQSFRSIRLGSVIE
jgi:hypothetical protein